MLGLKPAARLYTPAYMAKTRLKPGKCRAELEREGQELSDTMAQEAVAVAKGLLEGPYNFKKQKVKRNNLRCCDYSVDVEEAWLMMKQLPGFTGRSRCRPCREWKTGSAERRAKKQLVTTQGPLSPTRERVGVRGQQQLKAQGTMTLQLEGFYGRTVSLPEELLYYKDQNCGRNPGANRTPGPSGSPKPAWP